VYRIPNVGKALVQAARRSDFNHVAPHSIYAVRWPRSRVAWELARWG
jgi:hypothetical protein